MMHMYAGIISYLEGRSCPHSGPGWQAAGRRSGQMAPQPQVLEQQWFESPDSPGSPFHLLFWFHVPHCPARKPQDITKLHISS